jgi:4-hydroxythreonine-4-phosphate dehydrogenase
MAFCGGKLRVALLTWHIPLREVPAHLTKKEFSRTIAAANELARACGPIDRAKSAASAAHDLDFIPRIGVCGLNPHAGEDGILGKEEGDTIDPLLNELRRDYPGLSRTEPGDTLFARQLRGEFDVLVALYHDQGLAPLKTVDFDESVNVTLGLNFVRTSPDHGTAFSIAGKKQANPASFTQAVLVARRLVSLRSSLAKQ